MNGLVELVARDARWFTTGGTRFVFIPVVVTTATLWASNVELDKTEHTTGNLGDKDMGLTQKPWLYLQFPVSPGIKHARSPDQLPTELRDLLAVEYWRTIAIVNAASFAEYLACADVTDIFLDPVWTPPSR
jgi:hypothetical protein